MIISSWQPLEQMTIRGMKYMFVIFNYAKLLKRIIEVFGCIENFAIQMEMSKRKMESRLYNVSEFSSSEIEHAVELLKIHPLDISTHFFDIAVCRQ